MSNRPIDYFAPSSSLEEAVIRRIKGDFRRKLVLETLRARGIDSIPAGFTTQNIDGALRLALHGLDWRLCGGEDLPDLRENEVEIARLSLVDSIHGEVTSLRARKKGNSIHLRLVDEYRTEFDLPRSVIDAALTAEELIKFVAECDPCPLDTECQLRIASPFYEGLQQLLDAHLGREGSDDDDDDQRDD